MDAGFEVLDFGDGPVGFTRPEAVSGLLNVDQAVFVGVDERTKQNAAHEAENSSVGANTERKGSDHREGQPLGAAERPKGNPDVLVQQLRFEDHDRASLILLLQVFQILLARLMPRTTAAK